MATQIRHKYGVAVLEPSGRIVATSASELRNAIIPEIEASDAPRILINFANVNMIDSSGLGTLMEAHTTAIRKQGRIGVIHVGKQIKNLLVLSRLMNTFEHFEDEAAGISALSV